MFISKRCLPRRTFLRGMGAAVTLPLLDSMLPAQTPVNRTAAKALPRLGFVYVPHGAIMDAEDPRRGFRNDANPETPGALPQPAQHY